MSCGDICSAIPIPQKQKSPDYFGDNCPTFIKRKSRCSDTP
jgi:hypothetical protein